ncbi:MAG: hypothetical protein RBS68_09730, partial [Anaerolineales bacterium]|nr:hypothetical protein [Anaerolineales bacterium]
CPALAQILPRLACGLVSLFLACSLGFLSTSRITHLHTLSYTLTKRTIYRVKYDLLDEYLRQQIKSPDVQMRLA